MSELKRIPFDTGVFTSNGNEYYIAPMEMPYDRLVKFTQLQSEITRGTKLEDAVMFIYEVYTKMKSGDEGNYKQSYLDAFEEIALFCKDLEGYNPENAIAHNYDKYYEFCSYFILRKDEKYNEYDRRLQEDKIADWKKDMYAKDFFFAAWQRLNLLTEESNNFTQAINQM